MLIPKYRAKNLFLNWEYVWVEKEATSYIVYLFYLLFWFRQFQKKTQWTHLGLRSPTQLRPTVSLGKQVNFSVLN